MVIEAAENHHNVGAYNEAAYKEIKKLALAVRDAYAKSKQLDENSKEQPQNRSFEPTPPAPTGLRHLNTQPGHAETPDTLALGESRSLASSTHPLDTDFHQIDFPYNPLFVGREQTLKNIRKVLVDNMNAPRPRPRPTTSRACALFGLTGMGKSQTARQFVEDNRNHFHHIIWVYADTEIKIQSAYSEYASMLGICDSSAGPQAAAAALKKWFSKADQPWLVVLDNAEDKELIIRWWPRGTSGSVLITTVNPVFATNAVAGFGVEIKQLDEAEAESMITNELYSSTDPDAITDEMKAEALKLAQRTSCHPLLIKHCLGDVHERQCTLDYYNKQSWETGIFVDTNNQINSVYAPYERSLSEALRQRVEMLDQESRDLIDVFSLLDPDNISTDLFDSPQRKKWPQEIQNIKFIAKFAACQVRVTKGLVSHRGRDKHGREILALHRVNRDFLWHSMTTDSRIIAFNAAVRLLLHATDKVWMAANVLDGKHQSKRGLDHRIITWHFINIEAIRHFFQEHYDPKAASGQGFQDESDADEAYLDIPNFLLLLSGVAWYVCVWTWAHRCCVHSLLTSTGHATPTACSRLARST